MHTVLDLEPDWPQAEADESFEQTLIKACFCCFLAHNDRTKLAMIANKDHMFCAFQDRYKSLWFSCLSRLVDEDLPKFNVSDTTIKRGYTGCTDDVSTFDDFIFCLLFEFL